MEQIDRALEADPFKVMAQSLRAANLRLLRRYGEAIPQAREALRAALESNTAPPVVLTGLSWGAWLSNIVAALHPAKIRLTAHQGRFLAAASILSWPS